MSPRQILDRLYKLLGDAVLLPIPLGEKGPKEPNWQEQTFAESQKRRDELLTVIRRGGNLGVLLGPKSNRLFALDLDDDQLVGQWLIRHPWLANTLRSRGKRGCQFWFRLEDGCDYPNGKAVYKLPEGNGEIRLGGAGGAQSICWGRHPDGVRYQIVVAKQPLVISQVDLDELAPGLVFGNEQKPESPAWATNNGAPAPAKKSQGVASGDLNERIRRYMAKVPPSIEGQDGDNQLFRAACILVQGWGLSPEEALPFLVEYNQRAEPPWPERRLQYKLQQAETAPCDKPRGDLRDSYARPSTEPPFSKRLKEEKAEAEQAESERSESFPPVDWTEARSALKGGKEKFVHEAIYPEDSILAPYIEHVRQVSEGVDGYIIGSILPIVAAALGRRVWFPWDNGPLFTNLFNILVGRPGDRKSSVIKSAAKLGRALFPTDAFLPSNVSVEALFDEYYEPAGGRADKLWVCDDANVVLANWKNSSHGERVSAQFLRFFDCMELAESFVRNRKKDADGKAKRVVEETSTSILFGATFSAAAFAGTQIKAGMARRFLYYAGDGHGRVIVLPVQAGFKSIVELFKPLLVSRGSGMRLSDEAYRRWEAYQLANRSVMDELDPSQEVIGDRLNTSPTWVLKIAMIFEACRAVSHKDSETHEISDHCLKLAIAHVDQNLRSAEYVDKVTEQRTITQEAEIVLAVIRQEFEASPNGTFYCTRSQLTRRFCANGRGRSSTVDELYHKLIPALERIGMAKLVVQKGRLQVYAFAPEERFQSEQTTTL